LTCFILIGHIIAVQAYAISCDRQKRQKQIVICDTLPTLCGIEPLVALTI